MICICTCGLLCELFNKKLKFIIIFILDLIFGSDDLLFLNKISKEQIYFYLKGFSIIQSDDPNPAKNEAILNQTLPGIKIIKSSAEFVGFRHDLVGANFHCFSYRNNDVKNMIWQMKFNDNMKVIRIFGYCLTKLIYETQARSTYLSDFFMHEKCFLIPIPVHYRRLMERGYNQCSLLCREIIKNLLDEEHLFKNNIRYEPRIIKRKVYKQKQSWIKNSARSDRGTNIENVFTVSEKYKAKIFDAKIILIDDVFTTGATINEAVKVLLAAGAGEVISFTIAR